MKTTRLTHRFYQRCVAFILALWMMIPVASAGAATPSEFAMVYNTTSLNLRADATSSSSWRGAYAAGTWVEITGEKNNWYSVITPDGKTGYMSKNFLTKGNTHSEYVGIVSNPAGTSFLNLREAPSYTAKVLGIYYNGVPFRINDYANGWYDVTVDGVDGYFRQEYVTRKYMVCGDRVATIQTPNNTALNLRSGPSKDYGIIRQYRGGQYVMVLAKGKSWWKVSVDGHVGFMSSDFLVDGIHRGGPTSGSSGNSSSSGSTNTHYGYGIVTNPRSTQVLNLRQEPDTSSRVLGSFRNGVRVTILDQGSEWCHVMVDSTGDVGYMMTQYLNLHNLPSKPMMTVTHPQGSFVNLRRWSSMNAAVLTRVSDGRTVEVLIPGEDWCKVRYNGTTGYMVSYFLD